MASTLMRSGLAILLFSISGCATHSNAIWLGVPHASNDAVLKEIQVVGGTSSEAEGIRLIPDRASTDGK